MASGRLGLLTCTIVLAVVYFATGSTTENLIREPQCPGEVNYELFSTPTADLAFAIEIESNYVTAYDSLYIDLFGSECIDLEGSFVNFDSAQSSLGDNFRYNDGEGNVESFDWDKYQPPSTFNGPGPPSSASSTGSASNGTYPPPNATGPPQTPPQQATPPNNPSPTPSPNAESIVRHARRRKFRPLATETEEEGLEELEYNIGAAYVSELEIIPEYSIYLTIRIPVAGKYQLCYQAWGNDIQGLAPFTVVDVDVDNKDFIKWIAICVPALLIAIGIVSYVLRPAHYRPYLWILMKCRNRANVFTEWLAFVGAVAICLLPIAVIVVWVIMVTDNVSGQTTPFVLAVTFVMVELVLLIFTLNYWSEMQFVPSPLCTLSLVVIMALALGLPIVLALTFTDFAFEAFTFTFIMLSATFVNVILFLRASIRLDRDFLNRLISVVGIADYKYLASIRRTPFDLKPVPKIITIICSYLLALGMLGVYLAVVYIKLGKAEERLRDIAGITCILVVGQDLFVLLSQFTISRTPYFVSFLVIVLRFFTSLFRYRYWYIGQCICYTILAVVYLYRTIDMHFPETETIRERNWALLSGNAPVRSPIIQRILRYPLLWFALLTGAFGGLTYFVSTVPCPISPPIALTSIYDQEIFGPLAVIGTFELMLVYLTYRIYHFHFSLKAFGALVTLTVFLSVGAGLLIKHLFSSELMWGSFTFLPTTAIAVYVYLAQWQTNDCDFFQAKLKAPHHRFTIPFTFLVAVGCVATMIIIIRSLAPGDNDNKLRAEMWKTYAVGALILVLFFSTYLAKKWHNTIRISVTFVLSGILAVAPAFAYGVYVFLHPVYDDVYGGGFSSNRLIEPYYALWGLICYLLGFALWLLVDTCKDNYWQFTKTLKVQMIVLFIVGIAALGLGIWFSSKLGVTTIASATAVIWCMAVLLAWGLMTYRSNGGYISQTAKIALSIPIVSIVIAAVIMSAVVRAVHVGVSFGWITLGIILLFIAYGREARHIDGLTSSYQPLYMPFGSIFCAYSYNPMLQILEDQSDGTASSLFCCIVFYLWGLYFTFAVSLTYGLITMALVFTLAIFYMFSKITYSYKKMSEFSCYMDEGILINVLYNALGEFSTQNVVEGERSETLKELGMERMFVFTAFPLAAKADAIYDLDFRIREAWSQQVRFQAHFLLLASILAKDYFTKQTALMAKMLASSGVTETCRIETLPHNDIDMYIQRWAELRAKSEENEKFEEEIQRKKMRAAARRENLVNDGDLNVQSQSEALSAFDDGVAEADTADHAGYAGFGQRPGYEYGYARGYAPAYGQGGGYDHGRGHVPAYSQGGGYDQGYGQSYGWGQRPAYTQGYGHASDRFGSGRIAASPKQQRREASDMLLQYNTNMQSSDRIDGGRGEEGDQEEGMGMWKGTLPHEKMAIESIKREQSQVSQMSAIGEPSPASGILSAEEFERIKADVQKPAEPIPDVPPPEDNGEAWVMAKALEHGGFDSKGKYVDVSINPDKLVGTANAGEIVWKRGGGVLWGKDINGADVKQGNLGNCWLLSSMSVLAENRKDDLVALFNTAHADKGIYGIKFFKNGVWCHVVIDDRLPYKSADDTVPYFARSKEPREMWVSLLEKAYAKVHHSYQNISGGFIAEALQDLTGGVGLQLRFNTSEMQQKIATGQFWNELVQWSADGHLLGASSQAGSDSETNEYGIVYGHAYSLTRVVDAGDGLKMCKLRNPWGKGEWTGDYSDDSDLWTNRLRIKLGQESGDDGEFWMKFEDFLINFRSLHLCKLYPLNAWNSHVAQGEWDTLSCGGNPTVNTWGRNPQWFLTSHATQPTHFAIVLVKKDVRQEGGNNDFSPATQIRVYDNKGKKCAFGAAGKMLGSSGQYDYATTVTVECMLPPSRTPYTIVPSTYEAGNKWGFTVRVYCKEKFTFIASDEAAESFPPQGWSKEIVRGSWSEKSAGGCVNHPTFGDNPQWGMTVSEDMKVAIKLKQLEVLWHPVQVAIVDKKGTRCATLYKHEIQGDSGAYCRQEEVICEATLKAQPYPYTIVASTYQPGTEAQFELSICGEKPITVTTKLSTHPHAEAIRLQQQHRQEAAEKRKQTMTQQTQQLTMTLKQAGGQAPGPSSGRHTSGQGQHQKQTHTRQDYPGQVLDEEEGGCCY